MTKQEAEEYAKEMTYRDAVHNALQGKCIPYRKATLVKLYELLEELKRLREQEPCEDAISRQTVLDAMYALCDTGETLKENPWRDNPHIDAVVETIERLQPVNPQYTDVEIQKMQELEQAEIQKAYELGKAEELNVGHWILYDHGLGAKYYQCSVCKGFDRGEKGKYCKWCGTRMVELKESENKE